MEKEKLKEILSTDLSSILEVLHNNSQNEGRVLTGRFRKFSKEYQESRIETEKELTKQIKLACDSNEKLYQKIEKVLEKYRDSLERENCFYIEQNYKQRCM